MLNKIRNIKNEADIKIGEKLMAFYGTVNSYMEDRGGVTADEWLKWFDSLAKAEDEMEKLYEKRRELNTKVM